MSNIQQESAKLTEELELINLELDEVVETLSTLRSDETESIGQLDVLNGQLTNSQMIIKEKQDWITSQAKEREEITVSIAGNMINTVIDLPELELVNQINFTGTS